MRFTNLHFSYLLVKFRESECDKECNFTLLLAKTRGLRRTLIFSLLQAHYLFTLLHADVRVFATRFNTRSEMVTHC